MKIKTWSRFLFRRVNKCLKYQAILALLFVALLFFHANARGSSGGIIITEIMFDPDGSDTKREWIEIYNSSENDLNLNGWKLYESSVNHGLTFFNGETSLKSGKYAVIVDDKNSFMQDYPDFDEMLVDSSFSLSNSGEQLTLKNEKGETEFNVEYQSEADSLSGYSLEYDEDKWRTSYVKLGTPGDKASVKEIKYYEKGIFISELFPNPFKSDYEEYIELFNGSDKDIDLRDWSLHDASKTGKYIFPESLIIEAKKYLAIFKKDFKFALNNSGNESVYLMNPDGEIVSDASYDGSKKNVSYNFNGLVWRWSKFLTPGFENAFNNEPSGKINWPDEVYENVYADFSISTKDKDGEKIKVVWDFGDGHKSYKNKTKHKYETKGIYKASVKYSDDSEDIIKEYEIMVEDFPKPKVKIVEVNSNPEGSDTKNETITIQNKSKKKINLIGWSIATGWKKFINHPIREDFIIGKGKTKILTREISSFSLNNKKDKIELRYPNAEVASKLRYKREDGINEGEIYKKVKGGWEWDLSQTSTKSIKQEDLPLVTDMQVESLIISNQSLDTDSSVIGNQSLENDNQELEKKIEKDLDIEILKNHSAFGMLNETKSFNNINVREEDGKYFLTDKAIYPKHYVVEFWDNTILKFNSKLGSIIGYFLE